MAISKNLYTRGLRQRLAGAVWYQQKGRTLVRELAASVSNPQTDDQMDQRVKLSNVVAAYKANAQWMKKYAFETKKDTWSVYNAFVSANLAANQVYLTKQDVEMSAGVVAPYMFLKGSLPSVDLSYDDSTTLFSTDLYTGDLSAIAANTTMSELSTALLDNNAGLQEGDQISFIYNAQVVVEDIPYIRVRAYELILDTSDTRLVNDIIGSDEIMNISQNSDTMNIISFGRIVDYAGQSVPPQGLVVCVSRDNGTEVKVSTQRMVLTSTSIYDEYSGDTNLRKARRSYAPENPAPFLAAGYQTEHEAPVSPIEITEFCGSNGEIACQLSPDPDNLVIGETDASELPQATSATIRFYGGPSDFTTSQIEVGGSLSDGTFGINVSGATAGQLQAEVRKLTIVWANGVTSTLDFPSSGD